MDYYSEIIKNFGISKILGRIQCEHAPVVQIINTISISNPTGEAVVHSSIPDTKNKINRNNSTRHQNTSINKQVPRTSTPIIQTNQSGNNYQSQSPVNITQIPTNIFRPPSPVLNNTIHKTNNTNHQPLPIERFINQYTISIQNVHDIVNQYYINHPHNALDDKIRELINQYFLSLPQKMIDIINKFYIDNPLQLPDIDNPPLELLTLMNDYYNYQSQELLEILNQYHNNQHPQSQQPQSQQPQSQQPQSQQPQSQQPQSLEEFINRFIIQPHQIHDIVNRYYAGVEPTDQVKNAINQYSDNLPQQIKDTITNFYISNQLQPLDITNPPQELLDILEVRHNYQKQEILDILNLYHQSELSWDPNSYTSNISSSTLNSAPNLSLSTSNHVSNISSSTLNSAPNLSSSTLSMSF